jgi:RHS repeat-associated protein
MPRVRLPIHSLTFLAMLVVGGGAGVAVPSVSAHPVIHAAHVAFVQAVDGPRRPRSAVAVRRNSVNRVSLGAGDVISSPLSMLGLAQPAGPPPPCIQGLITYNGTPPVINSGASSVNAGTALTVTSYGSWTVCGESITSYMYQWVRGGTVVQSGTAATIPNYATGSADIGSSDHVNVQPCDADGCYGSYISSNNVSVLDNSPVTPFQDINPASNTYVDGKAGMGMTMKYSDPDGDTGHITYTLYTSAGAVVSGFPAAGPTVASGADSSVFTPSDLTDDTYHWTAVATDSRGSSSGTSATQYFTVNHDPNTPTPTSPSSPATNVPTSSITLNATGSDPEGDTIGYQFTIYASAGCTGTVVVQSGWLTATGSYTVTPNTLVDGTTYYWCVQTRDYVSRSVGNGLSPISAASTLSVATPKLGSEPYWPMWHGDGMEVNEATGNLVLPILGPSFPTAAGSLGASFVYNLLDTRPSVFSSTAGSWGFADDSGAPARLIDHSVPSTGAFDSVERIEADGSSEWYGHVAGSDTYVAQPGDLSVLTRTGSAGAYSYVLSDPNGSTFQYQQPTGDTSGLANLSQAEIVTANGQAKLTYTFASGGKPTVITAQGKDGSGTWQTLATLTFNWSCTGALLCITGPDGQQWKYIGASGSTGNLTTVFDGTRNVMQIGYDGSNRPNSVKDADDLDPTHSGSGYLSGHAIAIGYDPVSGKVTSISDGVRNRFYTPSTITRTWKFAYYTTPSCNGVVNHTPQATHSLAQPAAKGCTEVTSPDQSGQPTPAVARVYYDQWIHPIEIDSPLETSSTNKNYTLSAYDTNNNLVWSEDGLGNATDNTYDPISQQLLMTTGPDPDGTGALTAPVTRYRYDESNVGTATSAGPALQGVQAAYYPNPDLTGYPSLTQNEPNVDSTANWIGGVPPGLGGQTTNFSVRWSGMITLAAGTYVFATAADGGSRVTIGAAQVVNQWTGQTIASPVCSVAYAIPAGTYPIVVEYHELTGAPSVKLQQGTSCASLSTVATSTLTPNWLNQTSVVSPANSNGGNPRVSFSHYALPATHEPDYTLSTLADGTKLVTSFTYDSYGRMLTKTLPKGNVGRVDANGNLTGSADSTYSTSYSYYTAGQTAAPPATCGGSAVNQLGLLATATPHGITGTSFVYDSAGRALATTKAAGTTCNTYDSEGNLTADKAPGEASASTYTYDPDGQRLTATSTSGTVSYHRNEAGQLIDTTDSYGAELENIIDQDGNVLTRRTATTALATGPVYSTSYTYDSTDELSSLTDPAGHAWSFFYDPNGRLKATTYPNNTFSWNDYLNTGWLLDTYNRHGTFSTLPSSPPADANALADFAYGYQPDGQIANETRTGQGISTPETTNYSYDNLGRLVTASGYLERLYCYDLDSNRTALYNNSGATCGQGTPDASYSYTTSALDELASVTKSGVPTNYSYTGDGQVNGRGSDSLTWDGRGRITGGSITPANLNVQYKIDATNLGTPIPAPFGAQLNTTTLSDGWHTVQAIATNQTGKTAAAPARVVKVQNGTGGSGIALRHTLGTNYTSASSNHITLTITNNAPIGDTVILTAGQSGSTLSSVSDSRGNTYSVDRPTVSNGNSDTAIASARVTTALQTGDTITATFAATAGATRAIIAADFSGLSTTSPWLDATASATGAGLTPSAGPSGTSQTAPELVIGAFSDATILLFGSGGTFTPTAPYQSAGDAGSVSDAMRLHLAYNVATTTGTFTASGTIASRTGEYWSATLGSYEPPAGDTTPPTTPGSPAATATPGTATLSWTASTDASGIAYYHVYRSTTSGFTPGSGNEIGQTTQLTYTDNGDGTTNGLPANTYYYKVIAQDTASNLSTASTQATTTITADPTLPKTAITAPAGGAQVSGTINLTATATDNAQAITYAYDAAGNLISRTDSGTTTRYLLGGLIETSGAGTITDYDIEGVGGALAHYTQAPTTGTNPNYLYYNGHGDLTADADNTGTRTNTYHYDSYGNLTSTPTTSNTLERYTAAWNKKLDPIPDIILMGARPYDPTLGRFLAVDPIDGGSLNNYDYAGQDPINNYDLSGTLNVDQSGNLAGISSPSEHSAENCNPEFVCEGEWSGASSHPNPINLIGRGVKWIAKHPAAAVNIALQGAQTGCLIAVFVAPEAGVPCVVIVGAVSVTVHALEGESTDEGAAIADVACTLASTETGGRTEALNHFCGALATAVEGLLVYQGRH